MMQADKTGKIQTNTETRNTVRQDKVVRVEDLNSPPVMEQVPGAPNENIVQNHLNIVLLNAF